MNPFSFEDLVVRMNVYSDLTTVVAYYLPGTVDCLLDLEAAPITPANAREMYTTFTPTRVQYKKGSRPFFEGILKNILTPGMSQWDAFMAISRWVMLREGWPPRSKDLPKKHFHGGTEEVIVLKGGGQCNETARLLTTMLGVAGIPSRQIGHWNADFRDLGKRVGHMTNEVYVNGKWVYIDGTRGLMVPKGKGWASAWEIRQRPDLIRRCPDALLRGFRGDLKPADMREFLLNNFDRKGALLTVTNYPMHQRHLYNFDYFVPPQAMKDHYYEQTLKTHNRLRQRAGRPPLNPGAVAGTAPAKPKPKPR